jgi:raffinose/stachyose/melibiose transport system substrate-binding protein
MTTPVRVTRRSLLGLAGLSAGALAIGACGSKEQGGKAGAATIDWWHISDQDPMLSLLASIAKDFETANPGVKINVTPLQNDAFKAKLTTVTQAGNPPGIFTTWGGGVLKQQVDAKLVKDITADVAPWKDKFKSTAFDPYTFDGKIYGVPTDSGMVGFWYNKALFSKAGVTTAPATWSDYLDAVRKLKAAGITPIALAGQVKWPGHYYWAYLAMRIAGLDALAKAAVDKDFNKPDFVAAGARLKDLVDLKPFQNGFLAAGYDTPDGQAATVGNGQAAMELMGQWAPSNHVNLSASKKGLGDDLGFFPFPAVEGGKGKITEAFGGGGGYAVGKNAPKQAVDFLKTLTSVDNARKMAGNGLLPPVKGADDGVKDPNLQLVAKTLASATGFQLYLDQAYAPAVGQQVNDSVADLLAGKATPEQVVKAVTDAAKR